MFLPTVHDLHSEILNPGSVQFSCSVMSDSLWLRGLQQARPPCPSPTPRVYSNSSPLSWWCHPNISSPSSPAFNLCQHQGLFQCVGSSHQVVENKRNLRLTMYEEITINVENIFSRMIVKIWSIRIYGIQLNLY